MDYGQPSLPGEDPLNALADELLRQTRRKLQGQEMVTSAQSAIAQIEERVRRMTAGQMAGNPSAGRLPLPEPGEGTRLLSRDVSLLGLREPEPDPLTSPDWQPAGYR